MDIHERDWFETEVEKRIELMRSLPEMMRHTPSMTQADVRRIADNTIARWVPLAERLGLYPAQRELQELSVRYGYPVDYDKLKHLKEELGVVDNPIYEIFTRPIRVLLDAMNIEYEIQNRTKTIFSIWRKMNKDKKALHQVYDIYAIRIVYKTPDIVPPLKHYGKESKLDPDALPLDIFDPEILTCWRIYTAVTAVYKVQTSRIKDWVCHPKPSGYQALQLTCLGPENNWVEVQIRSERMDYEAEHGNAAHWRYKKRGE